MVKLKKKIKFVTCSILPRKLKRRTNLQFLHLISSKGEYQTHTLKIEQSSLELTTVLACTPEDINNNMVLKIKIY